MKKLLKWAAIIVLSLIVLCIIAAVVIVNTINPNTYKPQIIAAVDKATGRSLSLPGNLSWSFFPNLGIQVGQASLSNPVGYSNPVFAKVDSADISIAVLPLLSGQLQANTLELNGLQLNLVRKSLTENNWTFTAASNASSAQTNTMASSANNESANLALVPVISNLVIQNANISFVDQTTGAKYLVQQVNFVGKHIRPGSPFGISTSFVLEGNQPQVTAKVSAKAKLYVDWINQVYRLDSINADTDIDITTQAKQNYTIDAGIKGSAAVDLKANTLDAAPQISINNIMTVKGELSVNNLSSQMNYTGQLNIAAFDLGKLMKSVGLNVPKFPNSNALSNASLQSQFNGDAHSFNLTKMQLTLNQSSMQGQFSMVNFNAPAITVNISLDQIDLSDYLNMGGAGLPIQNVNIQAQLSSQGFGKAVFPSTLNGQINASVQQITLKGVDINAQFTALNNLINKASGGANINTLLENLKSQFSSNHGRINPNNGKQTVLGSISVQAHVQQGILSSQQINLNGPAIQVHGSGYANLNKQNMDFLFNISQTGVQNGFVLPYRVSGTFSDPKEGVDWILFQTEVQKYLIKALTNGVQSTVKGTVNNLLNQLVNASQGSP